ncbi:MAG: Bax inhibitor-1 family protein [Planctomycetota bacterium]|nr:Bax inhibitor-1 family protein [Planctomycetota bacterium]
MDTTSVFDRSEIKGAILSDQQYNFILGAVLCWGFALNWLIVRTVDPRWVVAAMPYWLFLLLYFASCFAGIWLFKKSINPVVSFIGYNFVVVPFGFVVNLVVALYDEELVVAAIQVTGSVVVVMMVLGTLVPKFFQKVRNALSLALGLFICIELFLMFTGRAHPGWIDWGVALIFCGYIGYDWGRANQIPKTMDNAVDSAAALYMDIINLFLRILRIMGRSRD